VDKGQPCVVPIMMMKAAPDDDKDVYLDKLQTRGVKKFILYM
jgi:hypothetical protein